MRVCVWGMATVKQVGPGRYGYVDPRPRDRGKPVSQEIAALVQSYNEEVIETDEPSTAAEAPAPIGRTPRKARSGEYARAAFHDAIRSSKQAPK